MKVKCIINSVDSDDYFVTVENDASYYHKVIITICGDNSKDKAIVVDGDTMIKAITNAMNS